MVLNSVHPKDILPAQSQEIKETIYESKYLILLNNQ